MWWRSSAKARSTNGLVPEQQQTMVPSEHGNSDNWLALVGRWRRCHIWEATTRELTASTTMAILGLGGETGEECFGVPQAKFDM
jgi:hypothetical protein